MKFRLYEIYSENKANTAAAPKAMTIGSSPDAIGLFRLTGWSLSSLASKMSLKMYVAEVVKLKDKKAMMTSLKSAFSSSIPEKTIAAKRDKFFTQ